MMSSKESKSSMAFPEVARSGGSMPMPSHMDSPSLTVTQHGEMETLAKCLDSAPPLELESLQGEISTGLNIPVKATGTVKLVVEQQSDDSDLSGSNLDSLSSLSSSYVRAGPKAEPLSQELSSQSPPVSLENNLNLSQPDGARRIRDKTIFAQEENDPESKQYNGRVSVPGAAADSGRAGPPSCLHCGGCVGASGGVEEEGRDVGQRLLELRKSVLDWLSGRLDTMLGRSWMDLAELHGWNYQQTLDFKTRCQAANLSPFLALLQEPAFQTYTVRDLQRDLHRLPRKDILLELDRRLANSMT